MQKHSESARGLSLWMYYDIAAAAFLPAPMARITVAAPVTASPPAKTPGRVVAPFSSATRQPRRFVSSPAVVLAMRGLGEVPNDMIDGHTSLCRKKSC